MIEDVWLGKRVTRERDNRIGTDSCVEGRRGALKGLEVR